jgi:hypothetical protein
MVAGGFVIRREDPDEMHDLIPAGVRAADGKFL